MSLSFFSRDEGEEDVRKARADHRSYLPFVRTQFQSRLPRYRSSSVPGLSNRSPHPKRRRSSLGSSGTSVSLNPTKSSSSPRLTRLLFSSRPTSDRSLLRPRRNRPSSDRDHHSLPPTDQTPSTRLQRRRRPQGHRDPYGRQESRKRQGRDHHQHGSKQRDWIGESSNLPPFPSLVSLADLDLCSSRSVNSSATGEESTSLSRELVRNSSFSAPKLLFDTILSSQSSSTSSDRTTGSRRFPRTLEGCIRGWRRWRK